ncbi:MAG TPA: AAA family ATPase, partial [Thermoanaerobaculia bacterium]|nr:AAA family ATPase [Thermoanaerobaculia bacterium]
MPTALAVSRNPFPGLRPFDRAENDRFFGREEHVDELLRRLRGHRFVAVIGASGSGKSSLVRAGLLPALEGGFMVRAGSRWRIAIARPGVDPVGQLARALTAPEIFGSGGEGPAAELDRELERDMAAATLRRSRHGLVQLVREARMPPGESLLVVIDQFEELFRYRDRLQDRLSDEAAAFVRLLLSACEDPDVPAYVVLTMRSDFLGDCAQFPGLPEAINESQYLVPRLSRRQIERAIRGPVGVGGATLSGPLLQRLLNDVSDDPDQLPILQHALMRTFDRWLAAGNRPGAADEPIGLEHYRAIGGMEEALSRHADEAYAGLAVRLRPVAASVFKSLTELGTDGRGVRRPTSLAHLAAIAGASQDDVRAVVDAFRAAGRTFLTPWPEEQPELAPEQVIDISHESLMRVWRRLVGWVEQEAEAARFYRRLTETAKLYPHEAGLWRNPELEIAARWRADNRPTAAWAERYGGGFDEAMRFLEASEAAWAAERRAEEERNRAESSKRLAFQSERLLDGDHELALLLAVAAGRASPTDEAERALRRALDHRGRSFALLAAHRDRVVDVACATTPGGPRLASASLDGEVVVWDAESFQPLHRLSGHRTAVRLAWSGDGRRLATAGIDGTAGVWDPATGELLHRLTGHRAGIADAAWHADGRRLATAAFDRTARVWDAETGAALAVLEGHGDWLWRAAWHGDLLATAGGDGTVRVFRVGADGAAGDEARVLTGHVDKVRDVAWSPGGERLASVGSDGTVRVWDPATGEPLHRFDGHRDWVVAVAWSADGERLASASRDGTARVWSVGAGAGPIAVLAGHDGEVSSVAWSAPADPGDLRHERVLTAGVDGTVRVWTVGEARPAAVLTGHRGPVLAARFTGRRRNDPAVVSGGFDGTVRFWDPGPGYQRIPRTEPDVMPPAWDARWSPDGERIATAHQDGCARVWNARTGEELRRLALPAAGAAGGRTGAVVELAWSPDGADLLVVSRDHRAACWQVDRGEAHVYDRHRTGVQRGAYAPGGDRVATGSVDGELHLWRPRSPGESGRAEHGGGVTSIAWHRDGDRLVTTGDDGTVVVWDTAGDPLTPRRLHTLEGHLSAVVQAQWSPDGRRLASVGMDQTVRIWDAGEGRLEHVFTGHLGWTLQVAWSPDGRQVASAGRDAAIRLWRVDAADAAGAHRPTVLEGHRAAIRQLSFSPAGDRLLTACQDGGVRLWHVGLDDPHRGDEVVKLASHDAGAVRAEWSPGGDRILTASLDGTLRVYLARPQDLVAEAERRAVRGPRPDEAELYGLAPAATATAGEAAPAE